jgi:hypothetical protein
MRVEATYICDRPGCCNKIPAKDIEAHLTSGALHAIWYKLKVIDNSGGWNDWDFCSLECIRKQIEIDPNALAHWCVVV